MKVLISALILLLVSSAAYAEDAQEVAAYSALTGNADEGRLAFAKCRSCHFIEPYMGHYNGPWLFDIFGRQVGSQDFEYSNSLKQATFNWTPEQLYFWLSYPETFLPDSQMVVAPFANDQEKADLIEYMKTFSEK